MNYESPSLELMGQMEELTGSLGTPSTVGDMVNRCVWLGYEYDPETHTIKTVCYDED